MHVRAYGIQLSKNCAMEVASTTALYNKPTKVRITHNYYTQEILTFEILLVTEQNYNDKKSIVAGIYDDLMRKC